MVFRPTRTKLAVAFNGLDRPGLCPGRKHKGATRMAANRQQGIYLGTTLAGFTALPAGLIAGGGLGILAAVVGVGLLVYSAIGLYRIKSYA